MGNIITIDFHGDRLLGIETEAGAFIPLRPLVLGMGLDWSAQRKRVRCDPILVETVPRHAMPSHTSMFRREI